MADFQIRTMLSLVLPEYLTPIITMNVKRMNAISWLCACLLWLMCISMVSAYQQDQTYNTYSLQEVTGYQQQNSLSSVHNQEEQVYSRYYTPLKNRQLTEHLSQYQTLFATTPSTTSSFDDSSPTADQMIRLLWQQETSQTDTNNEHLSFPVCFRLTSGPFNLLDQSHSDAMVYECSDHQTNSQETFTLCEMQPQTREGQQLFAVVGARIDNNCTQTVLERALPSSDFHLAIMQYKRSKNSQHTSRQVGQQWTFLPTIQNGSIPIAGSPSGQEEPSDKQSTSSTGGGYQEDAPPDEHPRPPDFRLPPDLEVMLMALPDSTENSDSSSEAAIGITCWLNGTEHFFTLTVAEWQLLLDAGFKPSAWNLFGLVSRLKQGQDKQQALKETLAYWLSEQDRVHQEAHDEMSAGTSSMIQMVLEELSSLPPEELSVKHWLQSLYEQELHQQFGWKPGSEQERSQENYLQSLKTTLQLFNHVRLLAQQLARLAGMRQVPIGETATATPRREEDQGYIGRSLYQQPVQPTNFEQIVAGDQQPYSPTPLQTATSRNLFELLVNENIEVNSPVLSAHPHFYSTHHLISSILSSLNDHQLNQLNELLQYGFYGYVQQQINSHFLHQTGAYKKGLIVAIFWSQRITLEDSSLKNIQGADQIYRVLDQPEGLRYVLNLVNLPTGFRQLNSIFTNGLSEARQQIDTTLNGWKALTHIQNFSSTRSTLPLVARPSVARPAPLAAATHTPSQISVQQARQILKARNLKEMDEKELMPAVQAMLTTTMTMQDVRLTKKIGHGAEGIVFSGYQSINRRQQPCALKYERHRSGDTQQTHISRIVDFMSLIKFQNPQEQRFRCVITEFNQSKDYFIQLMPLMELTFLDIMRSSRSMTWPTIRDKYFIPLLHQVWSLHQHNYYHRDIKPGNIGYLNGEVWLLDLDSIYYSAPGDLNGGYTSMIGTPGLGSRQHSLLMLDKVQKDQQLAKYPHKYAEWKQAMEAGVNPFWHDLAGMAHTWISLRLGDTALRLYFRHIASKKLSEREKNNPDWASLASEFDKKVTQDLRIYKQLYQLAGVQFTRTDQQLLNILFFSEESPYRAYRQILAILTEDSTYPLTAQSRALLQEMGWQPSKRTTVIPSYSQAHQIAPYVAPQVSTQPSLITATAPEKEVFFSCLLEECATRLSQIKTLLNENKANRIYLAKNEIWVTATRVRDKFQLSLEDLESTITNLRQPRTATSATVAVTTPIVTVAAKMKTTTPPVYVHPISKHWSKTDIEFLRNVIMLFVDLALRHDGDSYWKHIRLVRSQYQSLEIEEGPRRYQSVVPLSVRLNNFQKLAVALETELSKPGIGIGVNLHQYLRYQIYSLTSTPDTQPQTYLKNLIQVIESIEQQLPELQENITFAKETLKSLLIKPLESSHQVSQVQATSSSQRQDKVTTTNYSPAETNTKAVAAAPIVNCPKCSTRMIYPTVASLKQQGYGIKDGEIACCDACKQNQSCSDVDSRKMMHCNKRDCGIDLCLSCLSPKTCPEDVKPLRLSLREDTEKLYLDCGLGRVECTLCFQKPKLIWICENQYTHIFCPSCISKACDKKAEAETVTSSAPAISGQGVISQTTPEVRHNAQLIETRTAVQEPVTLWSPAVRLPPSLKNTDYSRIEPQQPSLSSGNLPTQVRTCQPSFSPEKQLETTKATQVRAHLTTTPSEPGKSINRLGICQICYDKPIDVIYIPCGHARTCEACATRIKDSGQPCPYCRKGVANIHRIYL